MAGKTMTLQSVVRELKSRSDPEAARGMARFAVGSTHTLGVSIPILRGMAKRIGKNHDLALELWRTGIHECRILASMVDDPSRVDGRQMESWAGDFDSWDVTDQCVMNLFEKLPVAWQKAVEWSSRPEEFVRRTGFVLMARFAVSDKTAEDGRFLRFFPILREGAMDERNFVKKAVNWAIRQIGKRNPRLHRESLKLCGTLMKTDSGSARWIAADAIRELETEAVRKRLARTAALPDPPP
jgi:3-methyladenine DNA glycosylase AlkD